MLGKLVVESDAEIMGTMQERNAHTNIESGMPTFLTLPLSLELLSARRKMI